MLIATTVIITGCATSIPIAATSNPVGPKNETAKETVILGITVSGEATIGAACAAGGIKRIAHVDLRRNNFLGIVQVNVCKVNGE